MAGRKRVAVPLLKWAGGHHVGVAREHQRFDISYRIYSVWSPYLLPQRAKTFKFCPQVGNPEVLWPFNRGFACEAKRLQAVGNDALAVGVVGRDGAAGDELLGES